MSLATICDGWMQEITTEVASLTSATQHLYAAWSFEALGDAGQGRHIAVFPEPGTQTYTPLVTEPAGMMATTFIVLVWESAASEATRLYDDEAANRAWLDLVEEIQDRVFVLVNQHIGEPGAQTDYLGGGDFGITGTARWLRIPIQVQVSRSFT